MIITDLTLLKIFINDRNLYEQYESYVKRDALHEEPAVLLTDIKAFYEEFPDKKVINLEELSTWFHQVRHPELTKTQRQLYNILFEKLNTEEVDVNKDFANKVIKHFRAEEIKNRIRASLESPGLEGTYVKTLIEEYEKENDDVEEDFVPNDFSNIFVKTQRKDGLAWRLDCLNRSIGPLIPGDFGYVAAYVNTGKTKFLCSEVAFMAQQIKEGSVLWFNNEGPEDRIQSQVWCSTLKASRQDIIENEELAKQRYTEKMNGDVNRIKFFDAVDFTPAKIRAKAKKYDAKLIVIDMLDHLRFKGKSDAEVVRLKQLYQAIRMISKEFCPIIGATQCDGTVTWKDNQSQEAQFQRYIGMHQLDYSRSAKQSAAEFIITIGKDAHYPNTRYIHVPKNKLDGDGTGIYREIKIEVCFDGAKSLYTDAQ